MKKLIICIISVMFLFCGKSPTAPANRAPVIHEMTATPKSFNYYSWTRISVVATDEDGDPLTYIFSSEYGKFSWQDGSSIRWNSLSGWYGDFIIKCTVSDGKLTVSSTVKVNVYFDEF